MPVKLSADNLQETIRLLQEELAETNQEVLLLTLELESRVEARTAELRATQEKLERANTDLRQLTVQLESRVLERTRELEQANQLLLQEIDERKRAEAGLRIANESLRRANNDLEQFAYSASHDLKEPLRNVAIYSELLARKYGNVLDAQAEWFLAQLNQSARRMDSLVGGLFTFTRVGSPPVESDSEITSASEVLQSVSMSLSSTITELNAKISHVPLPNIRFRRIHLEQLFQNLIGNALKYRSNQPPHIRVAADLRNESWLFSVADNGIGIPAEYQERIFGIFKRLHTADQYPGTGIGLAICKRIVECYHGRIWVESEPGNGATFYFTVPV